MSKDRQKYWEEMKEKTKEEILELNEEIEEELEKVKQKIADLQDDRDAAMQVYDGICNRLNVENDLEEEFEEAEEAPGQ